jgi:hypothetical protein
MNNSKSIDELDVIQHNKTNSIFRQEHNSSI